MIYLIVGQPRSGKSQYAVKLAFDIDDQNKAIQAKIDAGKDLKDGETIRPIYTDIDEHAQRCGFLQAPKDWRDVEDGAVIFYDEVHFRDEYLDQSKFMTQNDMIKELSVHGHRNIDIYLITQDPRRLEKSIRALVSKMYLAKRPANMPPFCNVYTFDRWLGDPWAASKNPDNVHDTQLFGFKKKYQEAYKSASAHTSVSFKLQRKFIYAIVALVCMISLSLFLFKISGSGKLVNDAMHANEIRKESAVTADKLLNKNKTVSNPTNSNDPQNPSANTMSYDLLDDLETKKIQAQLNERYSHNLNLTNYNPVLHVSGVIVFNGQCKAINHYSEEINMSQADCLKEFKHVTATRESQDMAQSQPAPQKPPEIEETRLETQNKPIIVGEQDPKEKQALDKARDDAWTNLDRPTRT